MVSRTHPGLIKRLFELEVPEIADGVVEIKACAREPGHRTKIAVWSNDPNVDPVGACVGARGARVRMVVNELRGEKIDIVPFSDDPTDFVMKALQPAKVKEVRIDEDTGIAEVIVPDYQLSLAIGKEGQNARLAARLTGCASTSRARPSWPRRRPTSAPTAPRTGPRASGSSTRRPASRSGSRPTAAPAMTLEQWEAAQAEAGAVEVEEIVTEALAEDDAEAIDAVEDVIAAEEVDEEEAELAEVADAADEPSADAADEPAADAAASSDDDTATEA